MIGPGDPLLQRTIEQKLRGVCYLGQWSVIINETKRKQRNCQILCEDYENGGKSV